MARQHQAINRVMATFVEKGRRRFAGLVALQFGRGGVQLARKITGLSRMAPSGTTPSSRMPHRVEKQPSNSWTNPKGALEKQER
jgi:hypothetical protein